MPVRPGDKYGMLTAVERVGSDNRGRSTWLMQCECGGTVVRSSLNLYQPRTHNCGCYRPQNFTKGRVGNMRTHGLSETPLYAVWIGMKQRCANKHNRAYKNYGGRGIVVCDEWADFGAFAEWADRANYVVGLDIDRIDNDGPYAPDNCRFVTRTVNMANTRSAICYSYWGESLPLKAASRRFGVDTKTIRCRIAAGMTPEDAVTFKGRVARN